MNNKALLPNVSPPLLTAKYWIGGTDHPDRLIMTAAAIRQFNSAVRRKFPGVLFELATFPATISTARLTTLLSETTLPAVPLYQHGQEISAAFREKLQLSSRSPSSSAALPVCLGFTLRRGNLKTLPTNAEIFRHPDDFEFDLLQETAVNPGEPIILLRRASADDWYFIQTSASRGWIPAADIVLASSRQTWFDYTVSPDLLVVTAADLQLKLESDPQPLWFEMGARLRSTPGWQTTTAAFPIKIPRSKDKRLTFEIINLPADGRSHPGFLPYTRANLLQQAFKMIGRRYGWGGKDRGVDCSGLIQSVFSCFGFQLPRNTQQQRRLPGPTVSFQTLRPAERLKTLRRLLPGALLYLDGHALIYLGEVSGRFYALHALADYGRISIKNQWIREPVFQVTVSDLDLPRADGRSILEAITAVKILE